MATMNHARHAHRGRPTQSAFSARFASNDNHKAKAAGPARSLTPAERNKWAADHGFAIAAR